MNKDDCCRIFNVEDIIDLPQAAMNIVMGDRERRDAVYRELLSVNRYDMSFDWFRQLYEEEFAQRKKQKQDFTPVEVSEIVAKIALPTVGTIHEPTAGTGGLIISAWWEQCRRAIPWDYYPSQHMISVWELSDRAIPMIPKLRKILQSYAKVYPGDYFVATLSAEPTCTRTLRIWYGQMLKAANVPYLNYHCLRHTFATQMIEKGVDVKTVSSILGHAGVEITMDTYCHPSDDVKRAGIQKAFKGLLK